MSELPSLKRWRTVASYGGLMAALAGLGVLAGWAFDIPALKSVFPGLVTMKANTAVGFVLLGIALNRLARYDAKGGGQRALVRVCSALPLAIGLVSLGEYAFNWDAGVDQLLFRDQNAHATSHPGRMSPATAASFVLLGLAFLAVDFRTRGNRLPEQGLALSTALMAVAALLGYLYGLPVLYRTAGFTAMALHTATLFLVLSAGLLCARPEAGFMQGVTSPRAGGQLARRLLPAILLLLPLLGWIRIQGQNAGLYGTEFGVILVIASSMVMLTALVCYSAAILNRTDAERDLHLEDARESEARLRRALDAANLGTWDWDLSSGRIVWGGHHARLLGLTEAQFDGTYEGFERCVHPEDRQGIREAVKVARETRTAYQREYRVVWPDGSVRWIVGKGEFQYDGQGAPVRMLGAIFDISERKSMEMSLRRLATAVDQAAEMVMITDPAGIIQYVNPAFERITGYTCAEAIGQTPRLLKGVRQDAEFYRRLWETLQRGEVWKGHFTNRRKDGTFYEEECTISPVRDATGAILNFVAVKRDVTQEKNLEAQLCQAQKMEAIGQLAGGVAHDFNNLLTVINGHSLLMLERLPPGDPLRREFKLIFKAGERAAGLTRQLLAFSRRQVLRPERLHLNRLVTEMQKLLQRLVREDISIAVVQEAGLPAVMADPGQMEQVLMNLVVNARDAMPHGGDLTIETRKAELDETYARSHPEVQPGFHVMLAVSDTGCGMDELTRARIFEPFFTTKEIGRGTGLGLATVHGIVKQSGGSIAVYSEPGRGTTFKIYLPCAAGEESPLPSQTAPPPVPKGREVVLLVEDENAVRELTREILQVKGYTVFDAANGLEALKICMSHAGPIHLVVSDLVMPGMGGPELARELAHTHPGTKFLFVSGYTDEAVLRHGALNGSFLHKPFTPESLARKVREVLDRGA